MENLLIYLQDENVKSMQNENQPVNIGELADRIIAEGKKLAGSLFKAYKNQISFNVSRPHINLDKKIDIAAIELDELDKNYNWQKSLKKPEKLRADVIENVISALEKEAEKEILWKYRYDIQVSRVAEILCLPKKRRYLVKLIEESIQTPELGEKIIFLGTAAKFGSIFNEFIKNRYFLLVRDKRGLGKASWRRTASILQSIFYVPNLAGDGETSAENLYKEIKSPSLKDGSKFFTIHQKNRK
jgi:hypothetical protein